MSRIGKQPVVIPAGVKAHGIQQAPQPGLWRFAGDQSRAGDRAGIDHWVPRPAVAIQADRIEGVARRLDPDLLQHRNSPMILQRQTINERLGDGLNGERLVRITHRVHGAIGSGQADSKPFRIGFRQFGNIRLLNRSSACERRRSISTSRSRTAMSEYPRRL